MAKAIINKHIDSVQDVVLSKQFTSDKEMRKGELLICNDPNNPTIYIMDTEGNPKKISGGGGGSGESYDDTAIWDQVNENSDAIANLEKNGAGSTIPNKIVVAGLSGQFGSGFYQNGDEIDAGTNVYEILENLLSQELYPSRITSKSASATAKMNALTVTLDAAGTVEVGTLVQLTKAQTNGSYVTTSPSSIEGMEYGYSMQDDDSQDSTNKTISSECVAEIEDNKYTISAVINEGFNMSNQNVPEAQEGDGSASLVETYIGCVAEGNNKITINATGASYNYHADAIDKVYYCSNLGKTDANQYHSGVDAVDGITTKPTSSASASVTGAYYYFMGYSANTSAEQFDSDSVRALTVKNGWINKDENTIIVPNETNEKSNGHSIVIACPSQYELKTINYSNQASMLSKFISGTVSVQTGEINTDYNVYVYSITNNAQVEFTNVSLGRV